MGHPFLGFPLFWAPNPKWNFVGGASLLSGAVLVRKNRRWNYPARTLQAFFFIAQICLGGVSDWKSLFLFLGASVLGGLNFLAGITLAVFLAFPRWKLRISFASFFLRRDFLLGVSYVGHPGWQFFAFL